MAIGLFALCCLTVLLSSCSSTSASDTAAEGVSLLPPAEFVQAMQSESQMQLIDCRTPGEAAGGMLEGAVLIDYRAAGFAERLDSLDRNVPVYVYCQVGGRSASAVEVLQEMGFNKVVELQGGYSAYRQNMP